MVNTLKDFLIALKIQNKIKLQQMHLELLQKEKLKNHNKATGDLTDNKTEDAGGS